MDKKDDGKVDAQVKKDVLKAIRDDFFRPDDKPLEAPEKKSEPPRQEVLEGNEGKKKIADLSDRLLRLQAEFDNYQKRTAKEKEQIAHHAEARMMLRMLPLYEELALDAETIRESRHPDIRIWGLAAPEPKWVQSMLEQLTPSRRSRDAVKVSTLVRELCPERAKSIAAA